MQPDKLHPKKGAPQVGDKANNPASLSAAFPDSFPNTHPQKVTAASCDDAAVMPRPDVWNEDLTVLALEIARVGGWVFDIETRSFLLHPVAQQMLGLPENTPVVSQVQILQLIHPGDVERVREHFAAAQSGSQEYQIDWRALASDSVRWIRMRGALERDAEGRPVRLVGVLEERNPRRDAEQDSLQTEQLYRALMDELDGIVWELDPRTLEYTFVSAGAEKLLGYPTRTWLTEKDFYIRHVHPGDAHWVADTYRRAVEQERDFHFEFRMFTHIGAEVWVQNRLRVRRDESGALRLFGVMLGLSQNRLGDELLRESEERFRTFFEQNAAGIALINSGGRVTRANRAFCELLGRTEDELRRMDMIDVVHLDDHAAIHAQRKARGGVPVQVKSERRIVRPDGEVRWLRLAGVPMTVEGGPTSYMATAIDVTAEKKIADTAKVSEEFFRDIADRSPVYLWLVDQNGTTTFMNRAFREFLGVGDEPADSKARLNFVHPDDRELTLRRMQAASTTPSSTPNEIRIRRMDGEYRWTLTRSMARIGANGEQHGYVGSAIDITDRKNAEEALIAAHERLAAQLTERERMESQLHSLSERLIHAQEDERRRMARDLHDDLGQRVAALGYSLFTLKQSLSEGPDAEVTVERIRVLEKDLANLGSEIRSLSHRLHPAMLELGGLATALRGLCKELRTAGLHVKPEIEVEDEEIPRKLALGAFRIVQEALQNVLKHSGVKTAHLKVSRNDDWLVVAISDAGVGFELEDRDGAGLGLISIRERARGLGGFAKIHSSPGQGATIEVKFPCSQPS